MSTPEDRLYEAASKQLWMVVFCLVEKHKQHLGSPIERLMLEALVAYSLTDEIKIPRINDDAGSNGSWQIETQKQLGQYRVDFLLTDTDYDVKVVIECDGHDFHERTKEQAERDRTRDRSLQAAGYLVLRYTGAEIWRDPFKCAEDVRHKIFQFDAARQT